MDKTLDERIEEALTPDGYHMVDFELRFKIMQQLVRDMQARIKELQLEKPVFQTDENGAISIAKCKNCKQLQEENTKLRNAITKTLEDNAHLADGDNCTLIKLKRVMGG